MLTLRGKRTKEIPHVKKIIVRRNRTQDDKKVTGRGI